MPRKHRSKPFTFPSKRSEDYEVSVNKSSPKDMCIDMTLLYCAWLIRSLEIENDPKSRNDILDRLQAATNYIENNKFKPAVTYDLSDPSKATISVNLFASEEEINAEINSATLSLTVHRYHLKSDHPELFPPEVIPTPGKNKSKIADSLKKLLTWYDQYKDSDVTFIVKDMYGDNAISDDKEFNRKKQLVYEKQRQAETCLRLAKLGLFPPANLTRARNKRPKK